MNTPSLSSQQPLLIQMLRAHPDVKVRPLPTRDFFALYHLDFGRTIYLADTDSVLFVHVTESIGTVDQALELLGFLKEYGPADQLKVLSVPSVAAAVPLAEMVGYHPNVALVGSAELDRNVVALGFEQAVMATLRAQVGLERLLLYQYRGAVTGNRFFGREHQVQALLRQPRSSYLVTGARMSGKTSLLLEAKRQLQNQYGTLPKKDWGIAYLDCREVSTAAGLMHKILQQLEERSSFARIERWESPERWPHFFSYLRGRAKRSPHRRLYLFLDEFDNVIDIENRQDVKLTWHFRALHQNNSQELGYIQFVLAGSKHLAAAQRNLSTGLHNFVNIEDCKLDNFDLGTVKAILERPLHDMGMEVEDLQEVGQALLSETGGRPASVQYVCNQMARRLISRNETVLTAALLHEVVASYAYLEYYEATLRENTDLVDWFVLSVSESERVKDKKAGFSLDDVLAEVRRHGVNTTEAQVFESLADLDNAGFIRPRDDRTSQHQQYVIAAPVITKIVRRRTMKRIAHELATTARGQRGGVA